MLEWHNDGENKGGRILRYALDGERGDCFAVVLTDVRDGTVEVVYQGDVMGAGHQFLKIEVGPGNEAWARAFVDDQWAAKHWAKLPALMEEGLAEIAERVGLSLREARVAACSAAVKVNDSVTARVLGPAFVQR